MRASEDAIIRHFGVAVPRAVARREEAQTGRGTRAFRPIVTVASTMKLLGSSKPTAGRAVDALVAAGVLVETTGRRRDRSWSYAAYLDRPRVGTELDQSGRSAR
jgi:hypothetical protein